MHDCCHFNLVDSYNRSHRANYCFQLFEDMECNETIHCLTCVNGVSIYVIHALDQSLIH